MPAWCEWDGEVLVADKVNFTGLGHIVTQGLLVRKVAHVHSDSADTVLNP